MTRLPGARICLGGPPPNPRRYTLTHNDLTGALFLSIGADFNCDQVGGLYTRILRDEVKAEWSYEASVANGSHPAHSSTNVASPVLEVYCHVSGEERWLAPPQLRNYIFRREMRLVSHDATLVVDHPRFGVPMWAGAVQCHVGAARTRAYCVWTVCPRAHFM